MDTSLNFHGQLLAIGVAPKAKAPLEAIETAVITDKGIAGDRYSAGKGAGQRGRVKDEQHVTLISEEAIVAACEESGLPITHLLTRRNLLVRGVPLADLLSKYFRVGEVVLFGFEDCAPCGYLEKMTFPFMKQSLKNRGGIRAVVVNGGTIRVGDEVKWVTNEERLADLAKS
ncbi:MOSC domain-containing protein [Anatilimnocola floriformis]|uniref:MOSC domain-containing protein n=1 Tax=Anatilimnocola floriformis TaxID=2948575 RepID=UPI0020C1C0A6|nr:MOSC domain-containing protein [Anatilimnocola floriformis]